MAIAYAFSMRYRFFFIVVLVSILPVSVFAEENWFFTTLTTKEGLPNASVSAIVQDNQGFLWFGTQNGLARYDGYTFKVFENEPFLDNVLSHSQVQTLYLDGDVLWIGTYGGLNRLDIKTYSITNFIHGADRADSLSGNIVVSICRDIHGNLWVGTEAGLDRLDEKTGTFVHYSKPANASGLPLCMIRDIHCDRQGELWIATHGEGLWKYDYTSNVFVKVVSDEKFSLPSPYVMSISEDSEGTLWFGTWFGGISRLIDRSTYQFETVKLQDDRIYFVNTQLDGKVLAGSWGAGLFVYDVTTKQITNYVVSDGKGALPNNVVYSALLDSNGLFWIGTNGGGVAYTQKRDIQYALYQAESGKAGSLPIGRITAIVEDTNETIWVAVYNGGLNKFDKQTGTFKQYMPDKKNKRSLPDAIINQLYVDSRGRLWLCTNSGLAYYVPETDDFTIFTYNPDDPDSIGDKVVFSILETPEGEYWIGLYQKGLDKFNPKTGVFTHFPPNPTDDTYPSDGLVYCMAYDSNGELWVGMNNGLNHYTQGKFIRYYYDRENRNGVSSTNIRVLFKDSKNRLWIGSIGGGLMRYDPLRDSFIHFTKLDGLPHNAIRAILEARDGSIWVTTASGLAIIDEDGYSFRGYSMYHSLRDKELSTGACITKNGLIYLGGQNVLYVINPLQSFPDIKLPRALISDIEINGQSVSELLMQSAGYVKSLRLSASQNNVHFTFASSDFREPRRNLYSWMLEGFDKRWSIPSAEPSAVYTNLPGGSYVFRLRVSDNNGLWNNEAYALPIRIQKPFLLSTAGIILYVLFLIGFGYAIALFITKKQLQKQVQELTLLKVSLEKANTKLQELAILDSLTGISNRRYIDHTLPLLAAEASRERKPLSLLMVDIDFFKNYNDKYGHIAGDAVLKKIAEILDQSLVRSSDIAARYGGEEFLIILPNTDSSGAMQVADKLLHAVIDAQIRCDTSPLAAFITISIGIHTTIPSNESECWDMVQKADTALYRAKNKGRNRIEIE